MPFVDATERLPVNVEKGFIGGARWRTIVVTADSGKTERLQMWDIAIHEWQAAYPIRSDAEIGAIKTHHMRMRGGLLSFPFKDHIDFKTRRLETIGTSTGSAQQLQLTVTYGIDPVSSDLLAYSRKIVLPIESTIVIYANGVALTTADWTLSEGGIINITRTSGQTIAWEGQFDVPVYLKDDHQRISMTESNRYGQIPAFSLEERVFF